MESPTQGRLQVQAGPVAGSAVYFWVLQYYGAPFGPYTRDLYDRVHFVLLRTCDTCKSLSSVQESVSTSAPLRDSQEFLGSFSIWAIRAIVRTTDTGVYSVYTYSV